MIPNNYLEEGQKKEIEFAIAFCKAKNFPLSSIEQASREDDIYRHIDIWINSYSFDVKAGKKVNRSDIAPNYNIHWIELKNVNGKKGWLFGDANYIAFELEKFWCICPRKSLISSLRNKINFSNFTTNRNDMFKVYRRKDRSDAIIKVDSRFLITSMRATLIPKK